jgi:hypothetical protein
MRVRPFAWIVLALVLGPAAVSRTSRAAAPPAAETPDVLAAELARWSAFVAGNTATDDMWKQVKDATTPGLARVQQALGAGRRLLALLRLTSVRENLYASVYLAGRTAEQRRDPAAFEGEFRRMGEVLKDDLSGSRPRDLDTLRPVALRAMAETAASKTAIYYHASLDYGRSTTPDSGLYYLGAAEAQRDFIALARRLSVSSGPPPPPVRSLDAGLDALQAEVLAAYRPPASVEKHPEFIGISSAIKESRELAAAGSPYGALLRYLQAAIRFGAVRAPAPALEAAAITTRLHTLEARLDTQGVDHSIGRLILEAAQADLEEHASDGAAVTAAVVATDVLPRYFAALDPSPARPPAEVPKVTVTLVRWPYT